MCPIKIFSRGEKFSIETWLEEIKPLVTEKSEIEYRQKSLKKLSTLAKVRILMQENQPTESCINSFSLSVKLMIVALMKEFKIVVTEKHYFDNRDESFLITTFWKIWTIKILMQGSISIVFQSNPLPEN